MKQAIIELTAAVRELAAAIKEGKEEKSPTPPIRRKPKKPTTKTTTRARENFVKPTVDEVAAHVCEKGYTFDPVAFWNYYESNGWKVGRNTMKSWTSACVTWQRKEGKACPTSDEAQCAQDARRNFLLAEIEQLGEVNNG